MHKARKVVRLLRRHDVAMHDMQRIAGLPHVQACKSPPCAPDCIKGASPSALKKARILQCVLNDLLGFLDRFRREVLQRKPTERQRHPGLHAMPMHLRQLERAAAEIADNAVGLVKT